MTKLFENVKMLCKERNISIRSLEDILLFPKNTISSWKNTLPSCRKVIEVAHYFEVSVDFLLGETLDRSRKKAEYSHPTYQLAEYAEKVHISEKMANGIITIIDIMIHPDK